MLLYPLHYLGGSTLPLLRSLAKSAREGDLSYHVQTRGPAFVFAKAPSFRPIILHQCLLFGLRQNHFLQAGPGMGLYLPAPADLAWHRRRHWIVRRHRTDQADKTLVAPR